MSHLLARQHKTIRQRYLVLDVGYLSWRAFFTTGALSYRNTPTGVIFGVLRDIMNLQSLHNTSLMAFCFDHGQSLRCLDYPKYKGTRRNKERSPEEEEAYLGMREQMRLLKTEYLAEAGFANVFYQEGYEADDIIAGVCQSLQKEQEAIIVSADHDMYQLLSDKVSVWDPNQKKMTTAKTFTAEWGIEPEAWIDVKSIAGCASDDIKGIEGVGEKTACKFITGKLNGNTKAFQNIVSGNGIWIRNRALVKLPYPGLKPKILAVDAVTPARWNAVAKRLGIKTLKRPPEHQPGFGFAK